MYPQKTFLQKYWLAIILIAIILVVIIAVAATYNPASQAQAQVNVESDVVASNLRVLNDTHRVQFIDWGTLTPNNTYAETLTVACDNTVQVTAETSEWNPDNATDYLTFNYSCTYAGIVTPYSDINITFSLTIAEYAPDGNFSFTITVVGNEASNLFVQTYGDWDIYQTGNTYVAVQSDMKRVITGVDLPDLKADIDEAMR